MNRVIKGFVALFASMVVLATVVGIVFLFSMISTFMWYTFDDKLAELLGNPMWGNIPWYNVYGFTWFFALITVGGSLCQISKNEI